VFIYDGIYSPNRERLHGRPVVGLSGNHFLGYSQNHDQIGNRARGERLSQLVTVGRLKIAAALELTAPFVPMLFQGEEFGASTPFQYFTHHNDKELAKAVSEGRRGEFADFGWSPEEVPDPQDFETLDRSKLKWDEIDCPPHRDIIKWYKRLIALRHSVSELTTGRLDQVQVEYDEQASWLVLKRGGSETICNFARNAQAIPFSGAKTELICSEEGWNVEDSCIHLPAESVAIVC
jgi:maltooligosyltrehalose trehalohydrolase